MRRVLRNVLRFFLFFLAILVTYLLLALVLTLITVNDSESPKGENVVYLTTNGVHLDVIIPKAYISDALKKDIDTENTQYFAFGWGDENFYINTPTWDDLTFKNAFSALFLNSSSLIHLTRYKSKRSKWVTVCLNDAQLENLNTYIANTFTHDIDGRKVILKGESYGNNDMFYKAKGSYSCFKTCNTWVNNAFKTSRLKSCYWTPFDFGLINKYKN